MSGDHGENGAYSEVFEEGEVRAQTVHRIRANSSIMQLKKILGESMLHENTQSRSMMNIQADKTYFSCQSRRNS